MPSNACGKDIAIVISDGDYCGDDRVPREVAPLILDDGPGDLGVCFSCSRAWTPPMHPSCPHCASRDTGRASLLCRTCDIFVPLAAWSEHATWAVHLCDAPQRAA
jgi:hypothetical protein